MELNDQQKKAVLDSYDKDTFLIASAGSGKTRVLTNRVVHILREHLATSYELLVLTFTTKAANEMKERIKANDDIETSDLTCGTFHSVLLKILKKYSYKLGKKSFSILDSYHQRKMLMEVFNANNMFCTNDEIKEYLSKISNFKNSLVTPNQALRNATKKEDILIAKVYKAYQNHCWNNNSFDFDDILTYSYELLKNTSVKEDLQGRFKYIFVDEAQDCNTVQIEILKLLKCNNNNIFFTGDDKQTIYGWRSARPDFMVEHIKHFPNSKMLYLEQNYRSTDIIVNASNSVISNNKNQVKMNAFSARRSNNKIKIIETNDSESEAKYVANTIKNLISNNVCDYKDIAILYRVNNLSRTFEQELSVNEIPYTISGGLSFWNRKEIKDITCFFSLINNPYDKISFERILNQFKGVGKKTIQTIINSAEENNMSLIDILQFVSIKNSSSLPTLLHSILTMNADVSCIAEEIISKTQMIQKYQALDSEEANEKIANIGEFVNIVSKGDFESVSDFVDNFTLSSDTATTDTSNSVKLMSIHSSKGLEFGTVFLVGAEEGCIPSAKAKTTEQIEEERRCYYVGLTRAKDNLIITNTINREIFGTTKKMATSRFTKEIDTSYVEKYKLY